jgi:polyisoprenoid-binding protein YceI
MITAPTTQFATGLWRVDPARSYVGFEVRHLRVTTVRGRFGKFTGRIRDVGDGLRIDGRVDTASVDTGDPIRDDRLRTGFFQSDRFPSVDFGARCEAPSPRGDLLIAGTLTIKDVLRPVLLQATTETLGDDAIRVLVDGEISRSAFGLEWDALRQAGRLLVSDAVKLSLAVVLTRDPATGGAR